MAKTRREFTPECKREAVALLESSGRSQMQVAAELGIEPQRHLAHIPWLNYEGAAPEAL